MIDEGIPLSRPDPGLSLFVAIGPIDHYRIFTGGDNLVQRRVEFGLMAITQFAVMSQFDDCLARLGGVLRVIDIRKYKSQRFRDPDGAGPLQCKISLRVAAAHGHRCFEQVELFTIAPPVRERGDPY